MPHTASHLLEHLNELRLRNLSDRYVDARRQTVIRMERRIGKPATSIRPADLDSYQRTWSANAASRTVEAVHLREYFGWLHRHGRIRVDPSTCLILPKRPRRLPRPISETDLRLAVDNAPARILPMLTLAAWAGLRACEIARLDRADVLDTAAQPILIADGKGRRQRVVPLGQTALSVLRAMPMPLRGPVFRREDGRPGCLSASQVSTVVNGYLHEIGLTATLHMARHRFGTVFYEASHDLRLTMETLGHADPATTSLYVAHAAQRAASVVRSLDEIGG